MRCMWNITIVLSSICVQVFLVRTYFIWLNEKELYKWEGIVVFTTKQDIYRFCECDELDHELSTLSLYCQLTIHTSLVSFDFSWTLLHCLATVCGMGVANRIYLLIKSKYYKSSLICIRIVGEQQHDRTDT